MDLISDLGELAFASRLKRLSERLMKDVSRVYRKLDLHFEARWFPMLYTLSKQSPMTVTALAQTLGLTHTAVNQLAGEMTERRLLVSLKDRKDERKRLLRLSKEGVRTASSLAPVWREIRLATRSLIASSGTDLLSALCAVETLLDEKDMYQRVCERLKIEHGEAIEIVDYRPAYKKHFRSLNYEWLERLFSVEERDEALLSDPNGKIIRRGGAVLFARMGDEIVGACALVRHGNGLFELAKMAVAPRWRGRKIGARLALAVIDRARAWGGCTLFLETSPKLVTAIRLYEKLGFKKTGESFLDQPKYRRKTLAMKLALRG